MNGVMSEFEAAGFVMIRGRSDAKHEDVERLDLKA